MNGQHSKVRRLTRVAPAATALVAAFAALTFTGASARGASIVIDNFADPSPQIGRGIRLFHQDNPNLIENVANVGTIIGGEREVEVNVVTPAPLPNPFSAVIVVGQGVVDFGADSSSEVVTTLLYDGNDGPDINPNPPNQPLMSNSLSLGNIDFTMGGTQDGFRLAFNAVDAAPGLSSIPLQVTVTSAGGTATATTAIPEMVGPGVHIVPFSAFNIQGPLSSATSLRFVFNGNPMDQAIDFTLTNISTVPEPSTYALAGLGLVAAALIRRRRRS
jgi:hypothetical protein